MQDWRKNRNFRKYKNADGTFTYTITVDSKRVKVSEEVYAVYAEGGYKMEHTEFSIKSDRFLQDANGKAVRDEHGNAVMLPEREVSLDKLVDDDWDFPTSEPTPEDVLITAEYSEIEELNRCIAMLAEDEQSLINALFFEGKTIREYAKTTGQSKSKVDRQKTKIIGKLKNFFSN